MLTEVIQLDDAETATAAGRTGSMEDAELERRIIEEILERLARRSEVVLDQRLQQTLTPVLQGVAETVTRELHDSLAPMIRDIVARTIADELARLRSQAAEGNRLNRPIR
jgi:hypothetical protein